MKTFRVNGNSKSQVKTESVAMSAKQNIVVVVVVVGTSCVAVASSGQNTLQMS